MTARHFSPPWTVDEMGSCFAVKDHNGRTLVYLYFEDEAGQRTAAKPITRDQARRIGLFGEVAQY